MTNTLTPETIQTLHALAKQGGWRSTDDLAEALGHRRATTRARLLKAEVMGLVEHQEAESTDNKVGRRWFDWRLTAKGDRVIEDNPEPVRVVKSQFKFTPASVFQLAQALK